jgi:hypothetical protein
MCVLLKVLAAREREHFTSWMRTSYVAAYSLTCHRGALEPVVSDVANVGGTRVWRNASDSGAARPVRTCLDRYAATRSAD